MIGDDRIQTRAGTDYTYNAAAHVNGADALVQAWLTLKPYPEGMNVSDPGTLQKVVTTSNVVGTGQITDTGSGDASATIRFDVTAANTTALGARDYAFDVKVKTASGAEYPVAAGLWTNSGSTTLST